ncbi:hypothetical protein BDV96DRAFT_642727 [Lophiotrema nucula]|uniref:Uncharacterized protein n=1 Tax=Lophiotrema nucula TaxID=690887 RepID=A0A6A5ZKA5_9PLEO|nr:hypothetical protein BDV96DRAFT_642727 [Lophiotrema nucula]
MADLQDLDLPPFGDFPFDHFIMAKWDPNSPLTKQEQKSSLVSEYLQLGRYGRNDYFHRMLEWNGNIPPDVPQDLLTEEDRRMYNKGSIALWIRTWYGTDIQGLPSKTSTMLPTVTRTVADLAYRRLWRRAFFHTTLEGEEVRDRNIWPADIFDDGPDGFGVSKDNAGDGLVEIGTIPPFLFTVFMKCPDKLDGIEDEDWRSDNEGNRAVEEELLPLQQQLLVMVADRQACEQGWVLQLAIDHKGQVLPTRVRGKAAETGLCTALWVNKGEPLDADEEGEDLLYYRGPGKGWDN